MQDGFIPAEHPFVPSHELPVRDKALSKKLYELITEQTPFYIHTVLESKVGVIHGDEQCSAAEISDSGLLKYVVHNKQLKQPETRTYYVHVSDIITIQTGGSTS